MKHISIVIAVILFTGNLDISAQEQGALVGIAQLYHANRLDEAHKAIQTHMKHSKTRTADGMGLELRIYAAQHRYALVQAVAKRLAKEFPEDHRGWYFLALAKMHSCGGGKDTQASLRKAIECNPQHLQSYLLLAETMIPPEEQTKTLALVLLLADRNSPAAEKAKVMLAKQRQDTQQPPASDRLNAPLEE
jgi:cytochrome c-type biogenesis protein CcmH/NrfG